MYIIIYVYVIPEFGFSGSQKIIFCLYKVLRVRNPSQILLYMDSQAREWGGCHLITSVKNFILGGVEVG